MDQDDGVAPASVPDALIDHYADMTLDECCDAVASQRRIWHTMEALGYKPTPHAVSAIRAAAWLNHYPPRLFGQQSAPAIDDHIKGE